MPSSPPLHLGFGLAACSSIGPQPVTPIHVDAGRAAGLISAYRAQNGLGPVGVDSRLMSAAADYARAMGDARQDQSPDRRIAAEARHAPPATIWGAAAENLAAGYSSLDDAMRGWKASAGHRKNLLNPHVTEIGIAAVATPPGSKKRNYWALILASPPPERVAAGPFGMELVR